MISINALDNSANFRDTFCDNCTLKCRSVEVLPVWDHSCGMLTAPSVAGRVLQKPSVLFPYISHCYLSASSSVVFLLRFDTYPLPVNRKTVDKM